MREAQGQGWDPTNGVRATVCVSGTKRTPGHTEQPTIDTVDRLPDECTRIRMPETHLISKPRRREMIISCVVVLVLVRSTRSTPLVRSHKVPGAVGVWVYRRSCGESLFRCEASLRSPEKPGRHAIPFQTPVDVQSMSLSVHSLKIYTALQLYR
jgi:hypothetical protein